MTSALPQEIVDAVIDWVYDQGTLQALALASRSCLPRARQRLYRRVDIRCGSISANNLVSMEHSVAPLPSYVRDLHLDIGAAEAPADDLLGVLAVFHRVETMRFEYGYLGHQKRLLEVHDCLRHQFDHLEYLSLTEVRFQRLNDFSQLMRCFPQLSRLNMEGTIFQREDITLDIDKLGVDGILSRLRILRVTAERGAPIGEHPLLQCLARMIDPAICTAVEVAVHRSHHAHELLDTCGPHLRHLTVAELGSRCRTSCIYACTSV